MLALVDALFIEHVKLCHQVDYAVSWLLFQWQCELSMILMVTRVPYYYIVVSNQ